ncbi:hypothetical protein SAMN02745885_01640 [Carboxydocella sporoproducens DSM 16521]|uniref:Uncharacterized protein n=2 Tax=Carboxydocella TaxID=178898 RepID=A0A1T4QEP2_9FIRM|nr:MULTISPECIES: hypothetical protein [Carboxydocella]AVX21611.1 hypothetical protein CFE_2468 [Carboxydocella thermautotrophica]AVX31817.1 hypothetical protein CTH_2274 [Carboxydocella thermautotrophica]SKA02202.1 hypothetical protein SAMN02745885_01640 [Carboxydocella sporoproducens DSM 16521]
MNPAEILETAVLNLATGEVLYFMLPPCEAVKAAYLYSIGDKNTWDYAKRNVVIHCGRYVVSCGDWTARVKE